MEHIDLTITPDYIPGWKFWEGARELVQNGIDRECETEDGRDPVKRVMSDYRLTVAYDEDAERMIVENATTTIERRTLLLGAGTKRENGNTIGQHGEGYKLALLALVRCGRPVTVDNGPERWKPALVHSEALGAEVLRVEFSKGDGQNTALRFTVDDVLPTDWAAVVCNVRRLHDSGEEWPGVNGTLLISETEMGRLYVGGLFVQELRGKYLYGYDFSPEHLHLDRDRQKVTSFDLNWEIGELLASLDLQAERYVLGAMQETTQETQYLYHHAGPMLDKVNETTYREFREKYGDRAFPVDTEYRATDLRLNYGGAVKPVIVDPVTMKALTSSKGFAEWRSNIPKTERQQPVTVLRDFMEQHREYFPQTLSDAFGSELIDRAEVEGWTF